MKTRLHLAAALAALSLAAPAAAQAPAAQGRPTLGLGVAVDPFADSGGTIQLYMPLQMGQLRIEPSLGIFTSDGPTGEVDTRDVTLGVGVFVTRRVAPPVDLHLGGRLKLNFANVDAGVADDSGTDVVVAAALGGEYYFVPKFSLGLEGELGLYQNSDVSGDDDGLFTTGLGFLRVYF